MPFRFSAREQAALARYLGKWLLILAPVAGVIGSAVALFLWSLDRATSARLQHPWLLYLLPLAGALVGLLYHRYGKSVEGGNNLIMDQIHEPGGGVPARMAPLVLLGTLLTHLFGGSAGREGTAVQMGGSLASTVGRWLRLDDAEVRTLLMAGLAAGFGAVFGTPLTGAVFAMEVLVIGRIESAALVPVLLASVIGDWTVSAWGIEHTRYRIAPLPGPGGAGGILHADPLLLGKVALAAVAFGFASVLFAELAHGLSRLFKRLVRHPALRPAAGALVVIALVHLLGTRDYLGLGVQPTHPGGASIVTAFQPGGVGVWSWRWKILFTAVTLSSGFKGGEVTPLFFIGAALGNTLAALLGVPVDLLAGIGFVAVFAGATNTPLACTLMGIELFGAQYTVYFAAACFLAYLFSGHSGIYLSQRIGAPKSDDLAVLPDASLRTVRELRPGLLDGLRRRGALTLQSTRSLDTADMLHRHHIEVSPMGLVRVYLTARDRTGAAPGWKGFFTGRPLYRALVDAAKRDGIPSAMVHHTQYGYGEGGSVQVDHPEYGNTGLTFFVELIGPREQLEFFCRKHADLLNGRLVIHKAVEAWSLAPRPAVLDEAVEARTA